MLSNNDIKKAIAGATGTAISFASVDDVRQLRQIERYIGQSIERWSVPGFEASRPLRSEEARNGGRAAAPGGRGGRGKPRPGPGGGRQGQRSRGQRAASNPR